MKKIVIALITVVMLLQFGTVFSAADDSHSAYDLVAHWDFEGDTPYADKATTGTADPLTVTGNVTVKDGVAYIPDGENYLSASGAEGTDLYNFRYKTVLIKADIQRPDPHMVACLFSKKDTLGYMIELTLKGTLRYNRADGSGQNVKGDVQVANNGYRMYAITMVYSDLTSKATFNMYMSTKEVPTSAEDFVKVIEQTTDEVILDNVGDIFLGKRWDHLTQERAVVSYIDDVKIFNGLLTTDDMVAESPKTTLEPNVMETEPEQTEADTESDDTEPIIPSTPINPNAGKETVGNNDTTNEAGDTEDTAGTDTTDREEKTGCGSYVTISIVGVAACAFACAAYRKKKR